MTTLAEIEAAIDALPASEKQHLLLFVASRLEAQGIQFDRRTLTGEHLVDWMAEDEAAMRRFRPSA